MTPDTFLIGLTGFMIARCWNAAKRLWLYRSELFSVFSPASKGRRLRQLTAWYHLAYHWYDPYRGEPPAKSPLRWL